MSSLSKRVVYIAAFTVLGILVQFIAHAVIETWYIGLLLEDFSRYGFGWTWETWVLIHNILSFILLAAGALAGFSAGQFWWQEIYVKRRRFWRRR
ncbi:hypothetical protein C4552_03770 [Candidatus Parcubacteria bacterium]|nr:MAG: hypothetical protein C4552_03770 [Candidatus Parcubacteria bacterium]